MQMRNLGAAMTIAAALAGGLVPAMAKDVVIHAGRLIDGVSKAPRRQCFHSHP